MVARHDVGQNDDKGTRGPGDLQAAAAKHRNNQARNDGGIQALLGLDAAGHGESHR